MNDNDDDRDPETMRWELRYWRQEKILRETQVKLDESDATIRMLHRSIRAAILASGKLQDHDKRYVDRYSNIEDLLRVGRQILNWMKIPMIDTERQLELKEHVR